MPARRVVAGNWKMHHGPEATGRFFDGFEAPEGDGPTIVVFPPAVSVPAAVERKPAGVEVGVQNIHWEEKGAFTGEVSAGMAAEAGARYALVGHSERRHVFGETDEETARKVAAAGRHDLVPVLCVGETLEERRTGRVEAVILRQLHAALEQLREAGEFMVAYEPVWAIGTGETATPEDASEAHGTLRRRLLEGVGEAEGRGVPILYGGSVKPANARELLEAPEVDGVLVGGASLDPRSFAAIVDAARG